jgi:hypothetical protein
MKPWQFAVVALALLATAGCRSDPAVPILERQLRLQEDEIYRLRAKVDDFQDGGRVVSDRAADDSRPSEPATPREPASSRRRPGSRRTNGENSSNGIIPPVIELPSQPATGVPDAIKTPGGPMEVPDVPEFLKQPSKPLPKGSRSGGLPQKPASEQTRLPDAGQSDGPALQGSSGGVTSRPSNITMATQAAGATPFTPSGDSRHVAAIVLNRTLSGGISDDQGGGDQGLLVVVEPRDRTGRSIDAPADVSIAVLDPAVLDTDGKAMRVARWDFSAAETAAMFRSAGSSRAIHLTTTWPADPPTHNKLHLFVRYVTADGRKLEVNQPIEVALSGDRTAQWTPSDNGRRVDREAAESRQHNETPAARVPGPTPHTATRSGDAQPRRPVWSPERR